MVLFDIHACVLLSIANVLQMTWQEYLYQQRYMITKFVTFKWGQISGTVKSNKIYDGTHERVQMTQHVPLFSPYVEVYYSKFQVPKKRQHSSQSVC